MEAHLQSRKAEDQSARAPEASKEVRHRHPVAVQEKAPCPALSILSIEISHSDCAPCHSISTKQMQPHPHPKEAAGSEA